MTEVMIKHLYKWFRNAEHIKTHLVYKVWDHYYKCYNKLKWMQKEKRKKNILSMKHFIRLNIFYQRKQNIKSESLIGSLFYSIHTILCIQTRCIIAKPSLRTQLQAPQNILFHPQKYTQKQFILSCFRCVKVVPNIRYITFTSANRWPRSPTKLCVLCQKIYFQCSSVYIYPE